MTKRKKKWSIPYLFPLKSNNFPFMYQSTLGSGMPLGGVQFSTTGPPTNATVSFGTKRKSSRNTATKNKTNGIKIYINRAHY